LLEDVSVTVMTQVDKASLAAAFSSTSAAVNIFHSSDFIVTFQSHLNSFVDGTKPKWSKNKQINISQGSVATVRR